MFFTCVLNAATQSVPLTRIQAQPLEGARTAAGRPPRSLTGSHAQSLDLPTPPIYPIRTFALAVRLPDSHASHTLASLHVRSALEARRLLCSGTRIGQR
jgi:hypothetical protein